MHLPAISSSLSDSELPGSPRHQAESQSHSGFSEAWAFSRTRDFVALHRQTKQGLALNVGCIY